MDIIKFNVNDILKAPQLDNSKDNTMLNAFRIQNNASIADFNMIDGIADEYEDEIGIDNAASINEAHDATNSLYETAVDVNTRLLLPLDGVDQATTTEDFSTFKHTPITIFGDAELTTTDPKFGSTSLSLPEVSESYLEIGDTTDFKFLHGAEDTSGFTFTLDCWVKAPSGISDTINLFYTKTAGSNPVGIESWIANGGTIRLDISFGTGGQNIVSNGTSPSGIYPDDNAWHHLAFTYDHSLGSDNLKIWVDGIQVDQATKSGNTPSTANSDKPLRLGKRADSSDNWTNGGGNALVDEIRVSDNVRWTSNFTPPNSPYFEMALISDSFTAEAQSESGRILILKEDIDTVTLNTDLIASVSRDGGTTYTQVTLSEEGTYESNTKIFAADVDLSSQPAGTDMVYKIETKNSKRMKIKATGLSWT